MIKATFDGEDVKLYLTGLHNKLSTAGVQSILRNTVGPQLLALVDDEFVNSTDPYGAKWIPAKKLADTLREPGQRGETLVGRTGLLRRSFAADYGPASITIGVGGPAANYAPFHQRGTGIHGPGGSPFTIKPKTKKALRFYMPGRGVSFAKSVQNPGVPVRLMLPTQQRGIPTSWSEVISKAFKGIA